MLTSANYDFHFIRWPKYIVLLSHIIQCIKKFSTLTIIIIATDGMSGFQFWFLKSTTTFLHFIIQIKLISGMSHTAPLQHCLSVTLWLLQIYN